MTEKEQQQASHIERLMAENKQLREDLVQVRAENERMLHIALTPHDEKERLQASHIEREELVQVRAENERLLYIALTPKQE